MTELDRIRREQEECGDWIRANGLCRGVMQWAGDVVHEEVILMSNLRGMAEAARLREAEAAYDYARGVCEIFQMSREDYIRLYLEALPPLTWTSTGTSEAE